MATRISMLVSGVRGVQIALDALSKLCELELRTRSFPKLYASGVRYRREGLGKERWQVPSETLRLKHGDCEDLAAWRAAELRVSGIKARAICVRVRPGLIHCVVQTERGREDPSKRLGMKGRG